MLKLIGKGRPEIVLELNEPRLAIGRDESNALVLDDESVSGFHAELFVDDGRVDLVDLGSTNGTFIDDQPVNGRCALRAWQKVRFGQFEMEVVDPDRRRPTTTMASIRGDVVSQKGVATSLGNIGSSDSQRDDTVRGKLHLISNGNFPKSFELKSSCTVGREYPSDLKLNSDMVSSRHAKLEWHGDHYRVTDLASTNGTRINGKRIRSERLTPGDRLAFDEIEYVFKPESPNQRGKTQVNPAVGGRSGTTVRPAVKVDDCDTDTPSISSQETPGRASPALPALPRPRQQPYTPPSSKSAVDGPTDDPARTRVQNSIQPPRRAPLIPKKQSENRPDNADRSPQTAAPAVPAKQPEQPAAAAVDTERSRAANRNYERDRQQVVVKQGGNGCIIALLVIILLIIALPIIAVVFKVGFLMSIIASIRSFIPFLF